jgi:EmrB/QacA subfamily drug resistance transporter
MEQKWWTLIAVCVGIFMLLIDITVVNVALPQIQRSLHSSFSDLQWVVNAYALTLAALLLTAGSIADLVGRKRVFAIGLMLFTAASLVCGLSATAVTLNVARAVQGIGGAIMLATSLALIAQAFRGRDRGTAFAAYGAVIGAAVAVGPLVGGALTSGIGWRWIFFVNVPIGIGAAVLTLTHVAESRDPDATGVDWLGLTTFSGALFLFVYALIEGNDRGWGSTEILGCFGGALVLLGAFLVAELRQQRPMFDLSLLRRPAFAGASLVAFTMSGSLFSLFLFLRKFPMVYAWSSRAGARIGLRRVYPSQPNQGPFGRQLHFA